MHEVDTQSVGSRRVDCSSNMPYTRFGTVEDLLFTCLYTFKHKALQIGSFFTILICCLEVFQLMFLPFKSGSAISSGIGEVIRVIGMYIDPSFYTPSLVNLIVFSSLFILSIVLTIVGIIIFCVLFRHERKIHSILLVNTQFLGLIISHIGRTPFLVTLSKPVECLIEVTDSNKQYCDFSGTIAFVIINAIFAAVLIAFNVLYHFFVFQPNGRTGQLFSQRRGTILSGFIFVINVDVVVVTVLQRSYPLISCVIHASVFLILTVLFVLSCPFHRLRANCIASAGLGVVFGAGVMSVLGCAMDLWQQGESPPPVFAPILLFWIGMILLPVLGGVSAACAAMYLFKRKLIILPAFYKISEKIDLLHQETKKTKEKEQKLMIHRLKEKKAKRGVCSAFIRNGKNVIEQSLFSSKYETFSEIPQGQICSQSILSSLHAFSSSLSLSSSSPSARFPLLSRADQSHAYLQKTFPNSSLPSPSPSPFSQPFSPQVPSSATPSSSSNILLLSDMSPQLLPQPQIQPQLQSSLRLSTSKQNINSSLPFSGLSATPSSASSFAPMMPSPHQTSVSSLSPTAQYPFSSYSNFTPPARIAVQTAAAAHSTNLPTNKTTSTASLASSPSYSSASSTPTVPGTLRASPFFSQNVPFSYTAPSCSSSSSSACSAFSPPSLEECSPPDIPAIHPSLVKSIVKTLETPEEVEQSIRFLYDESLETATCPVKRATHPLNSPSSNESPAFTAIVEFTESILHEAIRKERFSGSADLRVTYALFVEEFCNRPLRMGTQLQRAMDMHPGWTNRWVCFAKMKEMERIMSEGRGARCGGSGSQGHLDDFGDEKIGGEERDTDAQGGLSSSYNIHVQMQQAERLYQTAKAHLIRAFALISRRLVDVQQVMGHTLKALENGMSSQKIYISLLESHPNSPNVMRAFSLLLRDVFFDEAAAISLLQEADAFEEETVLTSMLSYENAAGDNYISQLGYGDPEEQQNVAFNANGGVGVFSSAGIASTSSLISKASSVHTYDQHNMLSQYSLNDNSPLPHTPSMYSPNSVHNQRKQKKKKAKKEARSSNRHKLNLTDEMLGAKKGTGTGWRITLPLVVALTTVFGLFLFSFLLVRQHFSVAIVYTENERDAIAISQNVNYVVDLLQHAMYVVKYNSTDFDDMADYYIDEDKGLVLETVEECAEQFERLYTTSASLSSWKNVDYTWVEPKMVKLVTNDYGSGTYEEQLSEEEQEGLQQNNSKRQAEEENKQKSKIQTEKQTKKRRNVSPALIPTKWRLAALNQKKVNLLDLMEWNVDVGMEASFDSLIAVDDKNETDTENVPDAEGGGEGDAEEQARRYTANLVFDRLDTGNCSKISDDFRMLGEIDKCNEFDTNAARSTNPINAIDRTSLISEQFSSQNPLSDNYALNSFTSISDSSGDVKPTSRCKESHGFRKPSEHDSVNLNRNSNNPNIEQTDNSKGDNLSDQKSKSLFAFQTFEPEFCKSDHADDDSAGNLFSLFHRIFSRKSAACANTERARYSSSSSRPSSLSRKLHHLKEKRSESPKNYFRGRTNHSIARSSFSSSPSQHLHHSHSSLQNEINDVFASDVSVFHRGMAALILNTPFVLTEELKNIFLTANIGVEDNVQSAFISVIVCLVIGMVILGISTILPISLFIRQLIIERKEKLSLLCTISIEDAQQMLEKIEKGGANGKSSTKTNSATRTTTSSLDVESERNEDITSEGDGGSINSGEKAIKVKINSELSSTNGGSSAKFNKNENENDEDDEDEKNSSNHGKRSRRLKRKQKQKRSKKYNNSSEEGDDDDDNNTAGGEEDEMHENSINSRRSDNTDEESNDTKMAFRDSSDELYGTDAGDEDDYDDETDFGKINKGKKKNLTSNTKKKDAYDKKSKNRGRNSKSQKKYDDSNESDESKEESTSSDENESSHHRKSRKKNKTKAKETEMEELIEEDEEIEIDRIVQRRQDDVEQKLQSIHSIVPKGLKVRIIVGIVLIMFLVESYFVIIMIFMSEITSRAASIAINEYRRVIVVQISQFSTMFVGNNVFPEYDYVSPISSNANNSSFTENSSGSFPFSNDFYGSTETGGNSVVYRSDRYTSPVIRNTSFITSRKNVRPIIAGLGNLLITLTMRFMQGAKAGSSTYLTGDDMLDAISVPKVQGKDDFVTWIMKNPTDCLVLDEQECSELRTPGIVGLYNGLEELLMRYQETTTALSETPEELIDDEGDDFSFIMLASEADIQWGMMRIGDHLLAQMETYAETSETVILSVFVTVLVLMFVVALLLFMPIPSALKEISLLSNAIGDLAHVHRPQIALEEDGETGIAILDDAHRTVIESIADVADALTNIKLKRRKKTGTGKGKDKENNEKEKEKDRNRKERERRKEKQGGSKKADSDFEASAYKEPRDEMDELIQEERSSVVKMMITMLNHFTLEESLMDKYEFPMRPKMEHYAVHINLLKKAEEIFWKFVDSWDDEDIAHLIGKRHKRKKRSSNKRKANEGENKRKEVNVSESDLALLASTIINKDIQQCDSELSLFLGMRMDTAESYGEDKDEELDMFVPSVPPSAIRHLNGENASMKEKQQFEDMMKILALSNS
ncbi:uncharacterized protein MONOS_10741 [Monocercomonoides exilis]|uniref:uncharacterized protein n=1 Tax=Monocercomonoides exilis TaxID=2049356 RepID=UPI00355A4E48|nr:hypothetical protein MONOS_10741 [Monocercomonoides exilis]|eukprot:MONOS_10741.1-p1 / transcript=MONOS_10741.1 / gene=MONOS_10741 / organism=Monocercomonoides_exilis_PA203 / gene_product=unspecified product / transcript_product=unspecified product / location=Mono_scaffold00500:6416-14329(+) / protein_length=2576 / sequence_SO=supercontig / SO=protein_coding / is_pseudo=false